MKLYFTIIGIAMAIISIINIAFQTATPLYVIICVIWCTALQFILDGSVATLIKLTPNRWYGINNKHFELTDTEKRIHKFFKVKLWKDKVLELGGLGGFSKKELKQPDSPEYIEKFIIECNKGVVTHRISYFIGFLATLTVFNVCRLTIAIPVAVVNLFLNILPTMVLRYNTPKLKSLLYFLNKKT